MSGNYKQFFSKLREILENEAANDSIISWNEDGTSIIIHDVGAFSEKYLSSIFKHGSYESFVIQLELYGFTQVEPNNFKHPTFVKAKILNNNNNNNNNTTVGSSNEKSILEASLSSMENIEKVGNIGNDETDGDHQRIKSSINEIAYSQSVMMKQIEKMYNEMDDMSQALNYLKAQSDQFDQFVQEYYSSHGENHERGKDQPQPNNYHHHSPSNRHSPYPKPPSSLLSNTIGQGDMNNPGSRNEQARKEVKFDTLGATRPPNEATSGEKIASAWS